MDRSVITGFGILSPADNKCSLLWEQLLDRKFLFEDIVLNSEVHSKRGKLPDFDQSTYGIKKKKLRYMDKQVLYSLVAALEGVKSSKLEYYLNYEERLKRVGIVMGSMFAQMEFGLEQVKKVVMNGSTRISPFTGLAFYYGASVGEISVMLKTKGENCSIITGTSTGIDALMTACDMIRRQVNDIVIAGAGESIVFEIFYNSLSKTNRISKTAYRPFDIKRDGAFISNGAGVAIIESEKTALKREAEILGEVVSFCTMNDSSSLFELNAQIVDTTCKAILNCLSKAGINTCDIDLIIPTADGTEKGDYFELKALNKLFGGRKEIIYTPKPVVGYCLSFNTIIDLFVAVMIIKHSMIPGHPEEYDTGNGDFNDMLVGTNTICRNINNILILHRSWTDGKVSALLVKKYS